MSWSLNDLRVLSPVEFEGLIKRLFEALGFEVTTTSVTGDQGVDLRLSRHDERAIAQCKLYSGAVSSSEIREFFGALTHERSDRGYFVTTGTYSQASVDWLRDKPIALIDGVQLVAMLDDLLPTTNDVHDDSERWHLFLNRVDALCTQRAGGTILIQGRPNQRTPRQFFEALTRKFALPDTWWRWTTGRRFGDLISSLSQIDLILTQVIVIDEVEGLSEGDQDGLLEFIRTHPNLVFIAWAWNPWNVPPRVSSWFDAVLDASSFDWIAIDAWSGRSLLGDSLLQSSVDCMSHQPLPSRLQASSALQLFEIEQVAPSGEPATARCYEAWSTCDEWCDWATNVRDSLASARPLESRADSAAEAVIMFFDDGIAFYAAARDELGSWYERRRRVQSHLPRLPETYEERRQREQRRIASMREIEIRRATNRKTNSQRRIELLARWNDIESKRRARASDSPPMLRVVSFLSPIRLFTWFQLSMTGAHHESVATPVQTIIEAEGVPSNSPLCETCQSPQHSQRDRYCRSCGYPWP